MACDINTLVKLKETLLAKGYTEEQATLATKIYAMKNSEQSSNIKEVLTKNVTQTSALSEAQKIDLKDIVDKLVTRIESTAGSVTNLSDRIDKVIEKLLSLDERERLYKYLQVIQTSNGNIQGTGTDFISVLKDTIAIHEAKGNKAQAASLREKLKVEEEKAAKFEQLQKERMTDRDKLLLRLENLKKLAELIQSVTGETLTESELQQLTQIQEARTKMQDKRNEVNNAKILVNNLKEELKKFEKGNARYNETLSKLVEAKKKLKELQKEFSLLKTADEVLPKEMTTKREKLNSVFKTIQKEITKAREQINKVDSKEFAVVIRRVKKDLTEKTAKESKAIRDIRYGFKQRMELIAEYKKQLEPVLEDGEKVIIDIPFLASLIGYTPIEMVIKGREKVKLPDGTFKENSSDLSFGEAKQAIRNWKSLMISNINNGFYSTDLSVINEENLNYLKSIASGQEILDLSSPNVLDSIIVPSILPEDALAKQTLGITPTDSRAKTAKELATWLESTLATLESLKTANNFKGTISEAFLRIALHQKLFHIASSAFASTLKKTRKKRIVDTGSTDTIEAKKNIMRKLGLDPASMPEYNQQKFPNWQDDYSRIIGFDIEANGKTQDEITGIYSIQFTIFENGVFTKQVWMNSNNNLVNAIEQPEGSKDFLTNDQIQTLIARLEMMQQQGYKVASHNGNGYDFKVLSKFTNDPKQLTRVGIRSIDTLANLAFDNRVMDQTMSGFMPKRAPKGARLKDLALANLPTKSVTAFDGKITYRNGTVEYNNPEVTTTEDGTEVVSYRSEELVGGEDVFKYWEEGTLGDWTKFIAYASNDSDLTVDLILHFANQNRTTVRLFPNGLDNERSYEINTLKPRSNLFLDESPDSDGLTKFYDIIQDLIKTVPELVDETESIHYTYEMEYELDKIIDIFQDWLIQTWSLDPNNIEKVKLIQQGLEDQNLIANQQNNIIIELAQKNRRALSYLLKKKFQQFGFIDNLNLDPNRPGRLNSSVFQIDESSNRAIINSDRGLKEMFIGINTEVEYENRVLEHLSDFLNNNEFTTQTKFDEILRDKFKVRPRLRKESNKDYYGDVIPQILTKYVTGFKKLSDFGNANIDWKPAYDVGIAIVQLILDRRPGIIQQDNILINGDTIVNAMLLSGSSSVYQGRAKNFIIPNRDRVSFISPFNPITEERSYDNFRLIERIKFALSYDFSDPEKLKEFMNWAQTPQVMDRNNTISYFVSATKNTVFPTIRNRSPFENLLTLNERKHLAYSYIYDIPRLLTCFNHDCAYWGLNAGGRFLKDSMPIYYVDDFMSAGAPTARATLAGAMDQIAWMTVFNFDNPKTQEKLIESVVAAIKLMKTGNPEDFIEQTNKSDYKYSGLHISKAILNWYREGNFNAAYQILQQLGFDFEISDDRIVPAKGLDDPRFKAIDLMVADFNLLKNNREVYREKHRLTDTELKHFENLITKLEENREDGKEFLKGAITPRFFSAGFKGIYEGLLNKNKEKDLGFTIEEVKVATKVLLRQLINEHAILIDKATSLSQKNIEEIKEIFQNVLTVQIDPTVMKNTFTSNFFGEQDYDTRLGQMKTYFNQYIDQLAENLVPQFAIENRSKQVEQIKAELRKEYEERMNQAAHIFTSRDLKTLSSEEYAEVQTKVNQIMAGSLSLDFNKETNTYKLIKGSNEGDTQYLALWALNRRATTPFKLLTDNLELQRAVTGVHISPDDFQGWINKTIFHTYGMEIASGRNHMFGGWGNGPESSKLAQVRVKSGKEANPLGIWDIQDFKWSFAEADALLATQLALDLLPYYILPGYNTASESRENYWEANEQRSIEELKAQAYIDYLLAKDDDFLRQRYGMTAKQLRSKLEQYAGNPDQRFRLRTLASDTAQYETLMSMDASVEGLGSYRPLHADMDFTQRSIFGLLEAQYRIKKESTRESKLLRRIEEIREKDPNVDPNEVIPKEYRGAVSIFDKKNLPFIPAQTGDTTSSIIFGPKSIVEQKAIKIKNRVSAFAITHGWDQLLDKKDWTRLFLIQQLHYRSYKQVLKLFEEEGNDLSVSTKAKVTWFDGFFKSLGIRSKAFLQGKNFSTIDLMLRKEDVGVTQEDIDNLKIMFPDGISWLQTLVYLSRKLDRLEGIKVGVTLEPGIVVRGEPGLTKSPTRAQPNNIHGVEVRVLYAVIMASESTRIAATMHLQAQYPNIYEQLVKENKVDSNGYVLLEGMPIDEKITADVLKIALQNKKQLARELASKFRFILNGADINLIPYQREQPTKLTGPIAVEIPGLGLIKINSTVDNPNTLWAFTEDMIVEMLNSLENNELFTNVELAYQTNKAIATETTDLDILIQEQEKQQFADMAANEEETFDALMMLHLLEVDKDSAKPLTILDYRKKDSRNNPKMLLDMPTYFTQSIPLEIDGKPVFATLEESIYLTDIMQVRKIAEMKGMDEELKLINEFLQVNLTTSDPDLELTEDSPYTQQSIPVIKLAALLYQMKNSIDGLNKRDSIINFVQPGLSKSSRQELLKKAIEISDIMSRVMNSNKAENNQFYYIASARFDKMAELNDSILKDKSFESLIIESAGESISDKNKRLASRAIQKAFKDYNTIPQGMNFEEVAGLNFRSDISKFANKEKFIEAFGNNGENIVNQLNGLVTNGIISQRVMDMKLIIIGSLALSNRDILKDLHIETVEDGGPRMFATAAKRGTKYSIGLNIKAMAITPDNELLLKFAEELVHIARIKYMTVNSEDYRKLIGIFNTARSEEMIRDMLLAMGKNKPYDALMEDVKYAMKNPDEFLAHFGAMILLQETIYNPKVIQELETKYEAVSAAKTWWARAFYNIKQIAKQTLSKFAQLKSDPYYNDVYNASYSIIQNLLFNNYPSGRIDVNNPDMQFNAMHTINTTQKRLDQTQKQAIRELRKEGLKLEQQLKDPRLNPTDKATFTSQLAEINTRLSNPEFNPNSGLDISEAEIQYELEKNVKRNKTTGQIILRHRPDITSRALVAEALNNWSTKRGSRVDNKDTIAGIIRLFPDQKDRVTQLFQNVLLQGFNQTNLTYNSNLALPAMISDLIDNWTVTTQDSYRPSLTSGGFMANKLALDGYMGNLRYRTSAVARQFTSRDIRERINADVIRQLHGVDITSTESTEVEAVNMIAKAFKLWHRRLGEEMVNAKIIVTDRYLDPIGLKLRDARELTQSERSKGFRSIRNLIRNKILKQLDKSGENTIISPYILFVGELLPSPDEKFNDASNFRLEYAKFSTDPTQEATTAKEAMVKLVILQAINNLVRDSGVSKTVAMGQMQGPNNPLAEAQVQEAIRDLIYSTRQHQTTFAEALSNLNREEIKIVINEYRNIVSDSSPTLNGARLFAEMNNAEFGFYMGETKYANEYKGTNHVLDAMTYEFLGKLGATAYMFDMRSSFLNSADIFLNEDPNIADDVAIARTMFDIDIDSVAFSLLRGVGYDSVQRILMEQVSGISGFTFTFQQFIDMVRGVISSANPESKIRQIVNLSEYGGQEEEKHTLLLALDRLSEANKDARGTLGYRSSGIPLIDTLVTGGRIATQMSFGPNIGLATWLVEGAMGAVTGAIKGDNPVKFLVDAIDQNVRTFVTNTGDIVSRRNNKIHLFNVDPPTLKNVAKNCLWLFEEIYSPMLPGKLHGDGFSSEIVDRMSTWERFVSWQARSQSGATRAIRIASENQGNRRIVKDVQNRNLFRIRDSINKYLRGNPNPSNAVLKQVLDDAGVSYNVEVLLAFIRAGLFETVDTVHEGKVVSKIGVLETIDYMISQYQLERGTLPLIEFFSEEQNMNEAIVKKHGNALINQAAIRAARTAMMKSQKSYANMAMVIQHPLDGTASAIGHHVILNFYKSYPALFTAQFLMRRGSITPAMQFGFELLLYSLLDMTYNIMLSLASGYYQYEKIKRALEKREINNREIVRLLLKYPVFSSNLVGLGMQNIIPALMGGMNRDAIISSVAENAIGYDIRSIIKALQGWASYVTGEIPQQHPALSTYNVVGRIIPGIGNTLIKMQLMQAFGELNTSGRTRTNRSNSSYILDKIEATSDQAIRDQLIRNLFKNGIYSPAGPKLPSGGYRSLIDIPKIKPPEPKVPELPEVQPVNESTKPETQPGIVEQATTPIKAPM